MLRAHGPAWLGDPRLILVACVIWGFPWVGSFAVLTHLAKLQNIPKDIYEAASIDGASWWTKFTRIEVPLIMSSIYLMLVFVIIGTIKDAGMIIALTGGNGWRSGRQGNRARSLHASEGVHQPGDGRRLCRWDHPHRGDHGSAKAQLACSRRKSPRAPGKKIATLRGDGGGIFLLLQPGWRAIGLFLVVAAFPYQTVRQFVAKFARRTSVGANSAGPAAQPALPLRRSG